MVNYFAIIYGHNLHIIAPRAGLSFVKTLYHVIILSCMVKLPNIFNQCAFSYILLPLLDMNLAYCIPILVVSPVCASCTIACNLITVKFIFPICGRIDPYHRIQYWHIFHKCQRIIKVMTQSGINQFFQPVIIPIFRMIVPCFKKESQFFINPCTRIILCRVESECTQRIDNIIVMDNRINLPCMAISTPYNQ